MEFKKFKQNLQNHFEEMTKDVKCLFTVDLDKDELWNLYLTSFPKGTNEIFRESNEYDCCCCRHFIKSIGNVVSIKNGQIETIWNFEAGSDTFSIVGKALNDFVLSKSLNNSSSKETKSTLSGSQIALSFSNFLLFWNLGRDLPSFPEYNLQVLPACSSVYSK